MQWPFLFVSPPPLYVFRMLWVWVYVCVYHKDVILRVEVWLFEVPAHFGSALFDF